VPAPPTTRELCARTIFQKIPHFFSNSDTFDSDMYEEIVGCYRALSIQLLDAAQVIIDNQEAWGDVKNVSIKTIKRMLSAG